MRSRADNRQQWESGVAMGIGGKIGSIMRELPTNRCTVGSKFYGDRRSRELGQTSDLPE